MENEKKIRKGLLSVVIPVYNIGGYVERCVRSVLAQPDLPLEVLLVDDGSTDDSGAVCDALAAEDARITVLHKQNGGLLVEVGRHLYRTGFLRANGLQFRKGILHEDEEFTPRVLLLAQRVVLTGQVVYHYDNCRAGSITNAESLSTRRRWWQNRLLQLLATLVLLCGVAAAGLKVYADYTNSHFQVTFYQVTSSHVSEKLRILFLSDLHLREYGENNSELIQTVQELDPDLILLGGDLVTFPNPEYENMLSLCRSLADVAPLYGVLGNHESEMIYGGVDDQLAEKFSEAGVQLLRNETRTIQIGENNVELIGLEGALKDFYKYGASDCVESLSRQYDTFRICINHVPMAFVDYMQDAPFDLALAGHTHGGLIRLPVLGRLYTAEEGLFPEYAGGMYQLDSGAPLIVGCGLGDSNRIPRVYNPPELVLVDVNWY